MLQMPVLVLNASYEPINICGARRALILVLKGIARTEEEHGLLLHAQRSRIAMPSVIRLLEYRRIPHQTRALSRKNILLRDRNSCQYCAVLLPSSELTLDHVIPRSRGGNSTWENLVACCHACNRRKGNRMLNEIDDMVLLRDPRPFSLHTSRQIMRNAWPRRRSLAEISLLLREQGRGTRIRDHREGTNQFENRIRLQPGKRGRIVVPEPEPRGKTRITIVSTKTWSTTS